MGSLLLEFAIEIIPTIPYIGVVFPFILKEALTFLSLINLEIKSGFTVEEDSRYISSHGHC